MTVEPPDTGWPCRHPTTVPHPQQFHLENGTSLISGSQESSEVQYVVVPFRCVPRTHNNA